MSAPSLSDLRAIGDYDPDVVGRVKYGGHVRIVHIGGKFSAGLERYCNDVGSRNNVIFIPQTQMKKYFRIKDLTWKSIGDEMLVSYRGY